MDLGSINGFRATSLYIISVLRISLPVVPKMKRKSAQDAHTKLEREQNSCTFRCLVESTAYSGLLFVHQPARKPQPHIHVPLFFLDAGISS